MIGQSISHYKITSKLGEGGMGEVYRAIDTKLNRDVALKVLPEAFAADRERMARFSREAQVLASLNHPNIATIHGLEETDGKQALVLELVEGEDLSERIKRGAIPLEESLKIALQMAGALEAAHENGIIHRDLKPANVKITPDGTVKVLDFGLAKAFEPPTGEPDLSQSPTRSLDAAATEMGVVMGTAAYMSPEQARGKPVDKRTDIWAFGVVLCEMLTGKMAFQGEDISLTLAAVMKENPNWEVLPKTPRPIQNLLKRCLDRDQIHRLRDIGEARVAIQDYVADPSAYEVDVVAEQPPIPLWRQPTAITAVALALVIGLSAAWLLKPALPVLLLRKLTLEWGEDVGTPVISPNGRHVAYLRGPRGLRELWIRDLDREGPRQLVPEGMVSRPFWSPGCLPWQTGRTPPALPGRPRGSARCARLGRQHHCLVEHHLYGRGPQTAREGRLPDPARRRRSALSIGFRACQSVGSLCLFSTGIGDPRRTTPAEKPGRGAGGGGVNWS